MKKRFFWPPFTNEPKLEYLISLQSDHDVKKSKVGVFEEAVFGREKPHPLFSQPFDVFVDTQRRLFVSEPRSGLVKVIDFSEAKIDYLKDRKGRPNPFQQPLGVTGDEVGNIYVVDSMKAKISVFSPIGKLIDEWENDFLERPVSVAVDYLRKRAYIADPGQHKIIILALPDGAYVGAIGERGSLDLSFNFPIDVDLDCDGNLYVLDALNAKVKVFDPSGRFLRSFGERGTAVGSFQLPKALAVSPSGFVYVTDSMAHRFVIFSLQGQHLMTVGGKYEVSGNEVAPGGLFLPQGVDVDKDDGVWVVDTLNRMVHSYQFLTPEYLQEHPIQSGQAVIPSESQTK